MKVPPPALTIPLAGVMALVALVWIGLRVVPAALLSDPRSRGTRGPWAVFRAEGLLVSADLSARIGRTGP